MGIRARFELQHPEFTLDVDLAMPSQGVIGLFGRSGSGKTSLLRCIAGLERARGELSINGESWQSETNFLPAHQRPVGYVFQEASLFPHLSARGNLNYALKRAKKSDALVSLDHAVDLLNIAHLLDRRPSHLSGGERQRVAIARALLISPRLLLMDEPLASLDFAHKQEILPYLDNVHRELKIPVLYVSHSADEIARLADHLVVLDRGRVVAKGALEQTLARLDFPVQLGDDMGVVLDAEITERDSQWKLVRARFAGGDVWLRDEGHPLGKRVRIRILARDISLAAQQHTDTSILNSLPVIVDELSIDEQAGVALIRLRAGESVLVARITLRSLAHLKVKPGMAMWAQIKSVAVIA